MWNNFQESETIVELPVLDGEVRRRPQPTILIAWLTVLVVVMIQELASILPGQMQRGQIISS